MKKTYLLPLLCLTLSVVGLSNKNTGGVNAVQSVQDVEVISSSSEVSEHEANNAIDESFETSWIAQEKENQFIVVELPSVKKLNQVTQVFEDDDIWYFKIEASLDGEQYFDLLDNSFGVYGKVFTEACNGYAKFLRLFIIKSEKGFNPSSSAFYCFGDDVSDGTNVAIGAKAKSSTQANGLGPINVFDGNHSTFWCAGNGNYPQTVEGDLKEPVFVKKLVMTFNDHGTYSYSLSVKNVDESVDNIVTNGSFTGTTLSFDLNKKVLGVKFEALSGQGWANLTEIKLIGFKNILEKADGVTDLGCNTYLYSIENASDVSYSVDGVSFTKLDSLTNIDKTVRYLKGVTSSSKVYGTKLSDVLNIGFSAKVSSYLDEAHHVSNAFVSDFSADYKNSYYQSAEKGNEEYIELDLGRKCIIDKIYQEFNEESIHTFELEGSLDGKNYEVFASEKSGNTKAYGYTISVDNKEYRYIRLRMHPGANEYATSRAFYVYGNSSAKRDTWWQENSGVIRFYPKRWPITFKEIESQLDEFRYHGYRVIELHQPYEGLGDIWAGLGSTNFYQADPICGSNEDLTHLLNSAHEKGIKVFMFGNVGYGKYNADYFLKACRDYAMGINSKERNWFLFSDTCPNPSQWFWSDVANAYYYCFWDPAKGTIPTYNFSNKDWQEETFKYIDYWSDFGFDGIALDAPDAYYFGSAERKSLTVNKITHTLRQKNLMSLPEGSGNTDFIASYKYEMVQNYSISSWGAGASSLSLEASLNHSCGKFEENVKNVRDVAVGMGGSTMGCMNFEDRYDTTVGNERVMEASFVTTVGLMAFLHSGTDSKMGQDIMKTWDEEIQEGVHRAFALQNSMSSLNPTGERVTLPNANSNKYYAFYRTNSTGGDKCINIFNYSITDGDVTIDLKNTPFAGASKLTLFDAYNYETFEVNVTNGQIVIPVGAESHRTLILR